MRFFRNAARSASRTSFLRAYALSLQRARPQRRLRGGDFRMKRRCEKMTAVFPEIKLNITFKKKYTDEATLSWSNINFIVITEKQLLYNKNLTYLSYSVLV